MLSLSITSRRHERRSRLGEVAHHITDMSAGQQACRHSAVCGLGQKGTLLLKQDMPFLSSNLPITQPVSESRLPSAFPVACTAFTALSTGICWGALRCQSQPAAAWLCQEASAHL